MDAVASGDLSPDETSAAFGEVVWSWRRDPGVYPARPCGHGNGEKKTAHRGEHEVSRQTIARESRDVSAVPVKAVCALHHPLHTGLRARRRPAFPAPSPPERDIEFAEPGRKQAAGPAPCILCEPSLFRESAANQNAQINARHVATSRRPGLPEFAMRWIGWTASHTRLHSFRRLSLCPAPLSS